eukprot:NODE_600_length_6246_cov_0.137628.p1 type:complete len:559 gc:universal NODE_600_length_6246_cov_0.137628:3323-4999(+)
MPTLNNALYHLLSEIVAILTNQQNINSYLTHFKEIEMLSQVLLSLAFSVSVDCDSVKALAYNLKLNIAKPEIMAEISLDCCASFGTTCLDDRVIEINWSKMNLVGTLNDSLLLPQMLEYLNLGQNLISGSITSLKLPVSLSTLRLDSNNMNGVIPTLPDSLVYLQVQDNRLNGSLPVLPPNLAVLAAYNNYISGYIPQTLPRTLLYLGLSANILKGPFYILSYPTRLQYVYLQMNQLTGNLNDMTGTGILEFHAYSNFFTGDVPLFPDTLKAISLGMPGYSGNRFTGTLKLRRPSVVLINNNWITDVIIDDTTLLSQTTCDLSNNPLLKNDNVASYPCVKLGLFDANLPSNTVSTSKRIAAIQSSSSKAAASKTSSNFPVSVKSADNSKSVYKSSLISSCSSHLNITVPVQSEYPPLCIIATRDAVEDQTSSNLAQSAAESFEIIPSMTHSENDGEDPVLRSPVSTKQSSEKKTLSAKTKTATLVLNTSFNTSQNDMVDGTLVYGLFAGFCITGFFVYFAAVYFKRPSYRSKFGRRNSFGTLNTVNNTAFSRDQYSTR